MLHDPVEWWLGGVLRYGAARGLVRVRSVEGDSAIMIVTHGEIERREFVVQVGHHEARRRGTGWSPTQAVTCGGGRLLRAWRAVVHPVVVDVGALEDQSAFLYFDALVGAYGAKYARCKAYEHSFGWRPW